jgi:hypothetical protein
MKTLPVFQIDASQVGPLGLTLGQPADQGGATDPKSVVIPLIEVTWFDERQTCDRVHDFVFYSTPPDLAGCQAYVEGRCRLMGNGTPCAFHEGPEATVWAKAKNWKRIPITPEPPYFHEWAYFYDPDDQHVDGEPLPEDEEVEL